MINDDIKTAWKEIFPNSLCTERKFLSDNSNCFTFYLAKDQSEFNNGISNNDPLSYSIWLENGILRENSLSLFTLPKEKYLAYSHVNLRKKTIKQPTYEKIKQRFIEVRKWILENYDLDGKEPFYIKDK